MHKISTHIRCFYIFLAQSPALWFTLLLFSLLSVADFLVSETYRGFLGLSQTAFILFFGCFAILKATLLTAIYNLLKRWSFLRWLMFIFLAGYCLLSLLNGVSAMLYGVGISYKLFNVFYETNPEEIKGFVPGLWHNIADNILSAKFLLPLIAVILIYWFFYWIGKPRRQSYSAGKSDGKSYGKANGKIRAIFYPIFGAFLAISSIAGISGYIYIFSTTLSARNSYFIYPKAIFSALRVHDAMKRVEQYTDIDRPLPYSESLVSDKLADNVVLVIGESANRKNHSLYGYPLPTTPLLDKRRDELFLFTDAVASSAQTAMNIPRILTFMSDKDSDEADIFSYPSILQIFRTLDYKTFWISNQEKSGRLSNLGGLLSNQADVQQYVGSVNSEDHLSMKYDDAVLPPFSAAMKDSLPHHFICLHLMGSHTYYTSRYPSERNRITAGDVLERVPRPWLTRKQAQVVADYDNSILYTDSILNEIISEMERSPRPSVMVYLADHGECVYDRKNFIGRDDSFVDVPFIVYANEAYRAANPEIIERIKAALDRPFSTSETIQMLLTLTGTRYHSYDPAEDPLSPDFRPRTRYVAGKPVAGKHHKPKK